MGNTLLGIDLGTTNIKGIIIDDSGTVLAGASRPCRTYQPGPFMAEQKAEDWWDGCVQILREITEKAGEAAVKELRGISISSHAISLLPVDRDGTPVRNAIIYQDSRSAAEVEEICGAIGRKEFVNIVGGQPSVAFLPNKILWFKRNEPELFAKTACILQANGYLNYKLTGVFNQDADMASRTQCYHMSDLSVSKEIAGVIGADLETILPKPAPCSDIIGYVTEEAAKQTGLAAGIPVIAGCSDAMASMYATGMSAKGEAGESSGTTSLVFVGADYPSAPDAAVVTRPCYISGIPYLYDSPIGSAGASIKWMIETLCPAEKAAAEANGQSIYDILNDTAMETPAGAGGVLFFPYLVAGERAPLWNSHAKGMFIGMDISTRKDQLIRSVYEGTGFALRHVITTVTSTGGCAESLRITGGGSKSSVWNRIKASMLHMPVLVLDDNGGDVPFGDCLLAGAATGVFSDLTASIRNMIRIREKVDPVPEWERVYDQLYPYYVEMYQKLDETLRRYKETVDRL